MHPKNIFQFLRVLVLLSILTSLAQADHAPLANAQAESIDLLAPRLLKDINTITFPSEPNGLFAHNGRVYFTANDGTHGQEVWSTDGTQGSLQLLKDINPGRANGAEGSILEEFFGNLEGTLFFPADNGSGSGIELWKSNGTETGTVLVKDIHPSGDSLPYNFVSANGLLFFTADDGTGLKLWRTDGTPDGTLRVTDFLVSTNNKYSSMIAFDGVLFFQGCSTVNGCELWRSDGTPGEAVQVAEINPSGHANIDYLAVIGDTLYFQASDGQLGVELWKTTGSGAEIVADINPGSESSFPRSITSYQDQVYFVATTVTEGRELWRIDRGTGNAVLVKDFTPGPGDGVWMWNEPPLEMGGALYLIANDGTHGDELWKMVGSTFSMVADINPGNNGSNIGCMTVLDGVLYFSAKNKPDENIMFSNYELWRSNGTANGTRMVKDINPGADSGFNHNRIITFDGKLFFPAMGKPYQSELWISDTTETGTVMIPINKETGGASIEVVVPFGNNLFFAADDGVHGYEPWVTDGTISGTHMIKEILPGKENGTIPYKQYSPIWPVSLGGKLFFAGQEKREDGYIFSTVYVTDGTETGTQLLIRNPPLLMDTIENSAFVFCYEFPEKTVLYRTDGTPQGTVKIGNWGAEVRLLPSSQSIEGKVYFYLENNTLGFQLWESDGTPAGTHQAIITPRVDIFYNKGGKVLPNGLILYVEGEKLWQSDGTAGAEQIIEGDYKVGYGAREIAGDWLYFNAYPGDGNMPYNLYRTRGTSTGVELVTENIHWIQKVVGEKVYFTYWYQAGDKWEKHIGHAGGEPVVVKRLEPVSGTYHYEPDSSSHIAELYGQSYFYGTDADHGAELWTSDGTPEGTRVIDINPGPNSSGADNPFAINGRLLFTADDGAYGKEWWFIDPRDQWVYLPIVNR